MIFNDASLFNKLVELRNSGIRPVVWDWSISFIVNGSTYHGLNLMSIDRLSDFTKNYSDMIFVAVQVSQTVYNKVLLPNKDNIKVKLTKTANNIIGNSNRINNSYSETFNAFMTEPSSPFVMSSTNKGGSELSDDASGFAEIVFQLVDTTTYETRLWESGGVYKACTMDQLLRGILSTPLTSLNGLTVNVDLVPADNKKQYYQTVIPNGIRLTALPAFLQKKYGVYGSGMGAYIQKGQWYIFPLLNHQRFSKTTKTLTLLNVPKKDMGAADTSYIQAEDSLFVFATGDSVHIDKSEHLLNNAGRGVRYAIGANIVDGFRDADGSSNAVPSNRNMVSVNTEVSKTGLQNVHAAPGLMTDNPYVAMSNVATGMASMLIVNWEYSNPELLYPGMPVKVLYKSGETVQTLMGTLIAAKSKTSNWLANPTDRKYVTVTELSVLCERVSQN
jgi:hypothetical protein